MGKTKLNHYDGFEVIDRFQINKNISFETLHQWLAIKEHELTSFESELLEKVRQELVTYEREWNEEELKVNFIGFIFFLAHINEPRRIKTFFERKLIGKVNNIDISVIVDCMIATPLKSGRPASPYFFMQEYKRSLGDDHDPEGQMLAAMILAQSLNQDNKPVYGCWVQGKYWNFTTLLGSNYCVSRGFDATELADLQQIIFILRRLKTLILSSIS
jgi:hypothetical protein